MTYALLAALQSLPEIDPDAAGLEGWIKNAVVLAAIALVAFVLARSRTSGIYRDERDAYKAKVERLEDENKTMAAAKAESDRLLADCQAKTDLTSLRAEIKDGLLAIATIQHEIVTTVQDNTKAVLSMQSHNAAAYESLTQAIREWRTANGKA